MNQQRLHPLAWAALALFAATGARAEEDAALTALTRSRSSIEIGVRGADAYAFKADEYTGFTRKDALVFGHVDLRGGGDFDGADTWRWRLAARDLGTRSASTVAEFGQQGSWRAKLGVDGLRRQQSDSFQTPYLGVGTPTLTLPSNWVVPVVPRISSTTPNARGLSPDVTAASAIVNGVATAPTAAQTAQAAALQASDNAAFRNVDLYTQRTRHSVAFEHEIAAGWQWQAGAAREHTQGLRAQPLQSRAVGGDTSSVVPAVLDQDDDSVYAGVAYTSADLQLQARYETSVFNNRVPFTGWNLWASPATSARAAVAPSNHFGKFSLSGSWQLQPGTTLLAHASRSRATQNDTFLTDTTALLVPQNSAQALVVADSAGLKLQHRATARLQLGAGLKHEQRDNRTPVATYGYYDNNNPANGSSPFSYLYPQLGAIGQNLNFNANLPYSRRVQQFDADASYRLDGGRQLRAAWQTSQTERHCNGSWINCDNAPHATEHTLRLEGGGALVEDVQGRVAFSAAQRRVDYDENAFLARVPMAGKTPSTATGALAGSTALSALQSLGLNGWGPALGLNPAAAAGSLQAFYFPLNNVLSNALYGNGNRISELPGMRRYNQADRDRGTLRASLQWQPGERFSLQGAAEGSSDHYARSVYGLQRGSRAALHLDAGYAIDDRLSVSAFASAEDQRSRAAGNTYTANSAAANVNGATAINGGCYATIALRNANNKIDPCLDWFASTRDRTTTLGAAFDVKRLLGGVLDLSGSLAHSEARSSIDVTGGNYVNNPFAGIAGAATASTAATYFGATPLPEATTRSTDLRLNASWRIAPDRALRLGYAWQQLSSSDWRYEAMQGGGLTQVLPTREQAPHFRVHSLALGLLVDF